ncbi:uncharacterized protein LOC106014119, partial [Aplysia californica]|uniref:Uncharacterized protein LOC106014119 n=1 Tax=Aplysia californica TaxID=6500 RepID=A0ABM1AFG0_APLCA
NHNNSNNSHSLRVPIHTFDINADGEPTDTLTQNSITSLLSAKFRDVAKRWKQYGVESPRFRKRLHSKWESMNYDVVDSQLQRTHTDKGTSKKRLALTWLSSWLIYFFIGIGTAFLAAGVQISVELVAEQKFGLIRDCIFY